MKKMLLLLFGLAAAWSVAAKVSLPDAIGSNMVLQQNTNVKLWGWADPHAAVKVVASWGAKASAKSDGEGRWEVTLKTPAGSYEPQRITVASGDKRVLDNVLIGEVWFCSGQSNMDMPLGGYWNGLVEGGNEAIACADAQRGRIRFLKVAYSQGYTPQERVPGAWNRIHDGYRRAVQRHGLFLRRNALAGAGCPGRGHRQFVGRQPHRVLDPARGAGDLS